MVVQQLLPGIDGARNGDGKGGIARDLGCSDRRPAAFQRGPGRSASGAVEGHDPVLAARRIKGKAVAADAGRAGLDDALHGGGGDRCIHGIAAVLQDIDCGQGGKRMRGRRHALARHDDGTTGLMKISHRNALFSNGQFGEPGTQ